MNNNVDILKYLCVIKNADEFDDDGESLSLSDFDITSILNAQSRAAKLAESLKLLELISDYYSKESSEDITDEEDNVQDDSVDEDTDVNDYEEDTQEENPFNAYEFIDSDNIDRILALAALYKFCNRNNYK